MEEEEEGEQLVMQQEEEQRQQQGVVEGLVVSGVQLSVSEALHLQLAPCPSGEAWPPLSLSKQEGSPWSLLLRC
jgi:hypothetical protein